MTLAQIPVKEVHDDPATYRGIQVLRIRVGDKFPSTRGPVRYAVRVTPDLARDWLAKNHPNNRHLRPRLVRKYAADMTAGMWAFTPEPIIFSVSGVLQNGQNRLMAITEAGHPVWLMVDFGWPEDLIQTIDRGIARTNADALNIDAVPNAAITASAITLVGLYEATAGTTRSWSATAAPSSALALDRYRSDPAAWDEAVRSGRRVYDALQHGLGASVWTAVCYVIERVQPGDGLAFTAEIADGTGAPGSPTRRLADLYIRRAMNDTRSGDRREPMENILRGYRAWKGKGALNFVSKQPGFTLTKVK